MLGVTAGGGGGARAPVPPPPPAESAPARIAVSQATHVFLGMLPLGFPLRSVEIEIKVKAQDTNHHVTSVDLPWYTEIDKLRIHVKSPYPAFSMTIVTQTPNVGTNINLQQI